jgi:hypothetical protein
MSEEIGPPNGNDEFPRPAERRLPALRPPERALVLAARRRLADLPTLIIDRLPVLWNGGRGPLAQALVAGGLLALGSVLGRRASGAATLPTIVPTWGARPVIGERPPARVEFSIETEIGITTPGFRGPKTRWRRERVRVIRDWPPGP